MRELTFDELLHQWSYLSDLQRIATLGDHVDLVEVFNPPLAAQLRKLKAQCAEVREPYTLNPQPKPLT